MNWWVKCSQQSSREPWQMPLKEYQQRPLVRVVGQDFDPLFYHGTKRRNGPYLAHPERPESAEKKRKFTGNPLRDMFAGEMNEFGADMFLSEPRQNHQAVMFSQGRGSALFAVTLKPGSKILDLSDEATRAPLIGFGSPDGSRVIKFFKRPAMTDDFIEWYFSKVTEGYKERVPDWQNRVRSYFEPLKEGFEPNLGWRPHLVSYARERGYDAIRFADETLLVNRAAVESARPAKKSEQERKRTFEGGKGELYTWVPTGAYEESHRRHVEQAIKDGKPVPPEVRQRYGL